MEALLHRCSPRGRSHPRRCAGGHVGLLRVPGKWDGTLVRDDSVKTIWAFLSLFLQHFINLELFPDKKLK